MGCGGSRLLPLLSAALATVALLSFVTPARADGPLALVAPGVCRQPARPSCEPLGPAWKVVYVVGDLDYGGWITQLRIDQAHADAEALRALGMEVVELTPPDNSWEAIKSAALEANVLIYTGHGWRWDDRRTLGGGLYLGPDEAIHPDKVRDELRLRPNAIVILNHACYSAGYSSEDWGIISLEEAQRRVALYSLPFLQAGFAAYYADNWPGAPAELLRSLAKGQSLEQAFESQPAFSPDIAVQAEHPGMSGFTMWTSPDYWGGVPYYNHAFVGLPPITAFDLFSLPANSFAGGATLPSPSFFGRAMPVASPLLPEN